MPVPAFSPKNGATTPRSGISTLVEVVTPKETHFSPVPSFQQALAQLELSHAYEMDQVRRQFRPTHHTAMRASSRSLDLLALQPEMSTHASGLSSRADGSSGVPQPLQQPSKCDVSWMSDSVASKWADICWSLSCSFTAQSSKLNQIWLPSIHLLASQADLSRGLSNANMLALAKKTHKIKPEAQTSTKLFVEGKSLEFQDISSMTHISESVSRLCSPLHPTGVSRLSWDLFTLILCAYEIIVLPLTLASLSEQVETMSLVGCIFWTFDIGTTFMTSYFTYDGVVETRFIRIAQRYCKSWFVFDSILSLSDWIMLLVGDFFISSRAMASVLRLVRTMRLLRIIKLFPRFQSQLGRVTSQVLCSMFRLCSYILAVVIFNHYIACLWCATWSHHEHFESNYSTIYKYFTGLHWSFAHCLLGSMDIAPMNAMERLFACVVLVISLVVFSTLLSMITNDALELRAVVHDRNARSAQLLEFFSHRKLPSRFVCKIWHYVHRHNLLDSNRSKHDIATLSVDLFPPHVQADIRVEWFRPILIKHPFFRMYDYLEPGCIHTLCSQFITFRGLVQEEHLVWQKSTAVSQMIFVENGCLEYHPWDHSLSHVTIRPGMWACEEVLWSSTARIAGHMQAGRNFCDIILITREGFAEVARSHPSSLLAVMRYAREFIKAFNRACTDHTDAEVLFNDQKIACMIITAANTSGGTFDEIPIGEALFQDTSSLQTE